MQARGQLSEEHRGGSVESGRLAARFESHFASDRPDLSMAEFTSNQ